MGGTSKDMETTLMSERLLQTGGQRRDKLGLENRLSEQEYSQTGKYRVRDKLGLKNRPASGSTHLLIL